MKKYVYIIATIIIVILTTSCQEKVDFDLNTDENSRLVVEGSVTNQTKAHTVNLTRTSSYYESQAAPREIGAVVTIFDGTTYHSLTETSDGVYKTATAYRGEIGKTYTLNIETKNGQSYSSSSKLEAVAEIDSVSFDIDIKDTENDSDDTIIMFHYGEETPGEGDNYLWLVDINGGDFTNDVANTAFETDELVDGNYINGFDIKEVQLINLPQVDTFKITVELHSISRAYYEFLLAIVLETEFNGELFSGPPANIPSNISNGGLGFFRASAVNSIYLEIENKF